MDRFWIKVIRISEGPLYVCQKKLKQPLKFHVPIQYRTLFLKIILRDKFVA